MHANAELHRLVGRPLRISRCDSRLHPNRALDSIDRAGEVGDDAVAGGVEDAAPVRRDPFVDDGAACRVLSPKPLARGSGTKPTRRSGGRGPNYCSVAIASFSIVPYPPKRTSISDAASSCSSNRCLKMARALSLLRSVPQSPAASNFPTGNELRQRLSFPLSPDFETKRQAPVRMTTRQTTAPPAATGYRADCPGSG